MAKGFLRKAGEFLGISKFGEGIASSIRVATGEVNKDIENQQRTALAANKLVYLAKQEKDVEKKRRLLMMASDINKQAAGMSATTIDPGLNLSNKEILGSAANVALNIATPGAFKGGQAVAGGSRIANVARTTAPIVAKNAALGAGFGAASGLEKNRSAGGVIGSTVGGALIGGAIGTVAVGARAFKDFTTKTTPSWLMEKAIVPSLNEAKKTVKFGAKSLGQELLEEGVKGSPRKLLEIADDKLASLEDELQTVLSNPSLADARITKEKLIPYFKDLLGTKANIPGMKGDVQRIKNIIDDIPEQITLQQANKLKRQIYAELRDVSYKLDAKLGAKANTLKILASALKKEIEDTVGGTVVNDINRKLSMYGRLEDRIVDQLARSMKNNSFSLTDAVLTTGGIASMHPLGLITGLGAAGVRHAVGSTAFKSYAAQGLNKLGGVGTGKAANVIKGATKRGALNIP